MKKSKLLLAALVLGVAYVAYSAVYWGGVTNDAQSSASAAGASVARLIVMPHLIMTGVAVLFNAMGFLMNKHAFALVAGILYTVAMILFPSYFFFVLVQAILCYVAYALMKKSSKAEA